MKIKIACSKDGEKKSVTESKDGERYGGSNDNIILIIGWICKQIVQDMEEDEMAENRSK